MNPDNDIAQYLHDNGLGVYNQPFGNNIFLGPLQPPKTNLSGQVTIPTKSIWVIIGAGAEPDRVFGNAYRTHVAPVQIMVRGDPNKYLEGRDFAQAIWDAMEAANITGYGYCLAMQEHPVPTGNDMNGNPTWSLNFELLYQVNITA